MNQLWRHQLWIALAAAVVFFTNLGAAHLWDEDETIHATCAREMAARGDWVVPTFNGVLFPDKPPLMFWLMISGYKLFGMTEFAARFWSAVFAVGTALATYHLGRLLFRAEVGFWAGLIVASTLIFTVSARAATVDSALVFFNTAALAIFVASGVGARRRGEDSQAARDDPPRGGFTPGPWVSFLVLYAAIGVTVLAKGPVGFLLPVATMGLFLLIVNRGRTGEDGAGIEAAKKLVQNRPALPPCPSPAPGEGSCETASKPQAASGRAAALILGIGRCLIACARLLAPRNVWRAAWQLRPLTAIIVVGAVALPWYVLVGLRTDGQWLAQFLGEHNFQRAFRPFQSHSGPMIYYVPAILIGVFPWSVFLVPSLVAMVRRIRQQDAWRVALVFLSCWMGLWLAFWSIVSTKLPHYVLPMYPAMALMIAIFLDAWLSEPARFGRGWLTNALVTVIVVGIGLMVAMPILAHIFLPGEGVLGLVGLILVLGGLICLGLERRQQHRRVVAAFAAMSVAFVTAIFGFAALRVDRHQNAPPLVAEIRRASPGPTQLASYRFVRQSFVWYAGEPIARLNNSRELGKFLESAGNPCVVTNSDHLAEIEREFPGALRVMARQPRFLHSGEVLVLARSSSSPAPHTAGREGSSNRPLY